jgi:uncharacterized protein with ParB-like and HNH nuclease domain
VQPPADKRTGINMIPNGLTTLNSLFAATTLYVSHYQRAYSWDASEHVRAFLEDLQECPNDMQYFLGTVLLTEDRQHHGSELFEKHAIVDGQQRLTTVCIIMAVCQRLLRTDADQLLSDRILRTFLIELSERKFKTVTYDDAFFHQHIIQ